MVVKVRGTASGRRRNRKLVADVGTRTIVTLHMGPYNDLVHFKERRRTTKKLIVVQEGAVEETIGVRASGETRYTLISHK